MNQPTPHEGNVAQPLQVGDSHSLAIPSADVMAEVYFDRVQPLREKPVGDFTD